MPFSHAQVGSLHTTDQSRRWYKEHKEPTKTAKKRLKNLSTERLKQDEKQNWPNHLTCFFVCIIGYHPCPPLWLLRILPCRTINAYHRRHSPDCTLHSSFYKQSKCQICNNKERYLSSSQVTNRALPSKLEHERRKTRAKTTQCANSPRLLCLNAEVVQVIQPFTLGPHGTHAQQKVSLGAHRLDFWGCNC